MRQSTSLALSCCLVFLMSQSPAQGQSVTFGFDPDDSDQFADMQLALDAMLGTQESRTIVVGSNIVQFSVSNDNTSSVYCPAPNEYDFWLCFRNYRAYTNNREIHGWTQFECGGGICGDPWWPGHSLGASYLDFVRGISEVCNDEGTSFYGPLGGEWDGCTLDVGRHQSHSGKKEIQGVNQNFTAFPDRWYNGVFDTIIGNHGSTDSTGHVWAKLNDLDKCYIQQHVANLDWGAFDVTATLVSGTEAFGGPRAIYDLSGTGPMVCGGGSCTMPYGATACADIELEGKYDCVWVEESCGTELFLTEDPAQ